MILRHGDLKDFTESNSNITIMSMEEPEFSNENMIEAIDALEDYIDPTPTPDDLKCEISSGTGINYIKYSIKSGKEEIKNFLEADFMNGTILSLEQMLLIVECVIRSKDSVKKAAFRFKNKDDPKQGSGGKYIFTKWLAYALQIMERRRTVDNSGSSNGNSKSNNSLPEGIARTEELLVSAIMELICACDVIKKPKQVETLKNKFGVDWIDSAQTVS